MHEFMKKGVLLGLSSIILSSACDKGKYETKPTLKLKSINGNVIPQNTSFVVQFEFTDKEGDVDDTLFVVRQRLNLKGQVTMPVLKFQVPQVPHQSKGEIKADLDYNRFLTVGMLPVGSFPNFEPDTMMYHFVLKDRADNLSDTVHVGPIYVMRVP
jgi:hypothetical protein